MSEAESRARALKEKAARNGQEHIFRWWDELDEHARITLLDQLDAIDFDLLNQLVATLAVTHPSKPLVTLEPAPIVGIPTTDAERTRAQEARDIGEERLRRGSVGALLVAGGQGTRLGFDGPKGAFPIGPLSGKTLFQLFAEKIIAHRKRYGKPIPWYIMTSPDNHRATRMFFETHRFFGLPERDVIFFQQTTLPAVDPNGKVIMETKGRIHLSPDGHGGTLRALPATGVLDEIIDRGIEDLSYFQVDNVLVKVLDPIFIGYHCKEGADMSSKVVRKAYPEERVGIVGMRDGRLSVVEYSDLNTEDMYATNPDGSLTYWAGSIAVHMLRVGFINELAEKGVNLPYHRADKKVPYVDSSGITRYPESPNGIKFESFIFDALGYARHAVTMEVRRNEEFSPVKNATGVDSPHTARRALSELYASWLENAGVSIPRDTNGLSTVRIEISPLFALDADELSEKIPADFKVRDDLLLE